MKMKTGPRSAPHESSHIVLASNNGDIGGGEIMLLALAKELSSLGMVVTVVGPRSPAGFVEEANARGYDTVVVDASTRFGYARALRSWDRRHRVGILWCNGLLPAVATAGRRRRIAHLHQRPRRKQVPLAAIARWGSLVTLVPSMDMASVVPRAVVLHNWVADMRESDESFSRTDKVVTIRLGFLGRPSTDKGVEVLADAVRILDRETPGKYRLVLGGESRFVGKSSRSAVATALAGLGDLVEPTGWITPRAFFRRIDILVCPSIWPESFGLVVAEAMSARIPFVVSDAGALPEVAGSEHPWVATAGDAEDLAQKVREAAEGDSIAVENAFLRWQSQFSPEAGRQGLRLLLGRLDIPVPEQKKARP